VTPPILELAGISKQYGALRPLRVEHLVLAAGEQLAVLGLDGPAAEVLIHLITGTTLPDRGEVRVAGRSTSSIADGSEWLTHADRFGIVSERAVLLDAYSVLQNVALPFSLEIDPMPAHVRADAEGAAREVGLPGGVWDQQLEGASPHIRLRVRLARALAFGPAILLLEHPSVGISGNDLLPVGRDLQAIAARRSVAALTITADQAFAEAAAPRTLRLDAASGRLTAIGRTRWFGRGRS
jgi:ABC-type transporter Mla maintaining outer membrane lipid asymmetry ATPase subunit MlaF